MCRLAKCIKRNSSLYRKARLNLYASYASVCKAKLATYIYLIGMFLSFLGFVAPKILEFGSSDGEDIEGMHGTIGIWAYCLRDDGANINDCFNYAVGSFCTDPLFSAAYRLNDDITEGAQIDCNTLLDLREYGFSGDTDACVRCDKLNSMRATALMGFIAAWSCLFFLSMVRIGNTKLKYIAGTFGIGSSMLLNIMNCISVSWRTDVEDYIGWFSSLRNNQGLALTGAHNIEVRYGYSLYTMSLAYCFLFVGGVLIFFVPLPPQSSPSQHYTNVCHDCLSVCCKGHVLRRK